MKRVSALILTLLLVLSVFCSCSVPRQKPDEEPTTQAVTEPEPEETSVPQEEQPFFLLSELPKIGSYYDGVVYKRMTEAYVDSFQPSGQYGTVVPYIGDYRLYKSPYSDEDMDFDSRYPRFGLMTADGTVITDAVYDYAYSNDGLIFLGKSAVKGDKESFHQTIVPFSGKWVIETDCEYEESLWTYASQKDQRIAVFDYEKGTANVYDYNGKKLFTQTDIGMFEGTFGTGLFAMNTESYAAGGKGALLDKDGKKIVETEARVNLYGGNYHYFSAAVTEEKRVSSGETEFSEHYGIMKRDGSWLIRPKYKRAEVFGDKYFAYYDGVTEVICDEALKPIARWNSEKAESRILEYFNGELLYHELYTEDTAYYSLTDDQPITPKGKDLVDVQLIENTKWFFGIDSDGSGCLFTRDGTVKKTFANADRFAGFIKKGTFEILTGNEKKKTSHVIDAETLKELFTYTFSDGKYETFQYGGGWESSTLRYMPFYRYAENETIKQPYFLMDLNTGKVVNDHCDYIATYEIDGKEYCLVLKDNVSTVTGPDGKVLLRMPYTYQD